MKLKIYILNYIIFYNIILKSQQNINPNISSPRKMYLLSYFSHIYWLYLVQYSTLKKKKKLNLQLLNFYGIYFKI